MAENKMISIEKMDEILNDRFPVDMVTDYYGEELVVHRFIPYTAQRELVRTVADACFSDKGEYMPEVREFAFRICVIEAYTNVRLPENNIEHQYRIIFHSDLWDVIKKIIPISQIDNLKDSIQERIDAKNNANRAMFEREIQSAIDMINSIGEQLSGMFDGISAEDVQSLVRAIGDGVDETKIVEAVVDRQNQLREGQDNNVVQFPVSEEEEDGE